MKILIRLLLHSHQPTVVHKRLSGQLRSTDIIYIEGSLSRSDANCELLDCTQQYALAVHLVYWLIRFYLILSITGSQLGCPTVCKTWGVDFPRWHERPKIWGRLSIIVATVIVPSKRNWSWVSRNQYHDIFYIFWYRKDSTTDNYDIPIIFMSWSYWN